MLRSRTFLLARRTDDGPGIGVGVAMLCGAMAGGPGRFDRFRAFVAERPALVTAGAGASWIALQVLVVTRGRVSDALALAAVVSPTALLLGSVVSAVPFLCTLSVAYVVVYLSFVPFGGVRDAPFSVWVALLLAALGTIVIPAVLLVYALGMSMALGVFTLLWAGALGASKRPDFQYHATGVLWDISAVSLVGVIIGAMTTGQALWLPAEVVGLSNGTTTVAYVAGSSAAWTTLLRARDGSVVEVRSDDIASRAVCRQTTGPWSEPVMLLLFLGNVQGTPACPSSAP